MVLLPRSADGATRAQELLSLSSGKASDVARATRHQSRDDRSSVGFSMRNFAVVVGIGEFKEQSLLIFFRGVSLRHADGPAVGPRVRIGCAGGGSSTQSVGAKCYSAIHFSDVVFELHLADAGCD